MWTPSKIVVCVLCERSIRGRNLCHLLVSFPCFLAPCAIFALKYQTPLQPHDPLPGKMGINARGRAHSEQFAKNAHIANGYLGRCIFVEVLMQDTFVLYQS